MHPTAWDFITELWAKMHTPTVVYIVPLPSSHHQDLLHVLARNPKTYTFIMPILGRVTPNLYPLTSIGRCHLYWRCWIPQLPSGKLTWTWLAMENPPFLCRKYIGSNMNGPFPSYSYCMFLQRPPWQSWRSWCLPFQWQPFVAKQRYRPSGHRDEKRELWDPQAGTSVK